MMPTTLMNRLFKAVISNLFFCLRTASPSDEMQTTVGITHITFIHLTTTALASASYPGATTKDKGFAAQKITMLKITISGK